MNGFLPRKIGVREEDSKWASLVRNLGLTAILTSALDLFVDSSNKKQIKFNNK